MTTAGEIIVRLELLSLRPRLVDCLGHAHMIHSAERIIMLPRVNNKTL